MCEWFRLLSNERKYSNITYLYRRYDRVGKVESSIFNPSDTALSDLREGRVTDKSNRKRSFGTRNHHISVRLNGTPQGWIRNLKKSSQRIFKIYFWFPSQIFRTGHEEKSFVLHFFQFVGSNEHKPLKKILVPDEDESVRCNGMMVWFGKRRPGFDCWINGSDQFVTVPGEQFTVIHLVNTNLSKSQLLLLD